MDKTTVMGRPTMFAHKRAINLMITEECRIKLSRAAAERSISLSDMLNKLILDNI